ncbi:MAG: CBS domain-containing protein [Agarilytica sp.]
MNSFQDVIEFLTFYPPFNEVDKSVLAQLSKRIEVAYVKAGQQVNVNSNPKSLRILRSGSVEIRSEKGLLIDRISTGDCFGYGPILSGEDSINTFKVLEDGLVFQISLEEFSHLRHNHPTFDQFFTREYKRRIQTPSTNVSQDVEFGLSIAQIMQKHVATTRPTTSIHWAAKVMSDHQVSSLLITENDKVLGIVTDRDLRTRAVANNLDLSLPIEAIMTHDPIQLSPRATVHESYLTMMSQQIHHLPVTDEGKLLGITSLSDLIRSRNSEPLFLIQAIKRDNSVDKLRDTFTKLPSLIEKLILASVRAEEIGRIITSITDALTIRLIHLAEKRLGEAPVPYAWLAFGSQGRKEQALNSDQDNGLILANDANEEHIQYFLSLAKFVCEGLGQCGVKLCPGDVMAMNPKWCLREEDWRKKFFQWIEEPDPKALMHASIFYDMRMLTGNDGLVRDLRNAVLEKAKNNSIFLACLTQNALSHSPPLGFFKTFVLEKDGDHNSVLDMKHRGTIPIVDIARLYTLSQGIDEVNTLDRIRALKKHQALHQETADSLCDAHEFIAALRLENQQHLLAKGLTPSNNLDPDSVSPLTRHQLKSAFNTVRNCQQTVKLRFGHGVI